MSKGSGWLVKASCEGVPHVQITGLRPARNEQGSPSGPGYEELVMDLAEQFDLIPASLTLLSIHQGTKCPVHLGSQGDLDVVVAEAIEWGSHVITVTVAGVPARRALDALGALLDVAATVAQLLYLAWMTTGAYGTFYQELTIWSIMILTLLCNLGGFAYLLDDEYDKNHPFRLWMRPFHRRAFMFSLAPFTGDVLPLAGCKACALDAPIRSSTRDDVVKWGSLMMAFQHGMVLWLMYDTHLDEDGTPLEPMPLACLVATLIALLFNAPRRLSHFVLGTCEAAFREKEELADDAKISMYAAQKMAFKSPDPSPSRPGTPPKPTPNGGIPKASPTSLANGSAGKGGSKPPKPPPKQPERKMSFREQMKAGGGVRSGKGMY